MEFVEGISYTDYKKHRSPLLDNNLFMDFIDYKQLKGSSSVVKQIKDQIELFHQNNYIHGDLHSHNILVDNENKVYIIDVDNIINLKIVDDQQTKTLFNFLSNCQTKYNNIDTIEKARIYEKTSYEVDI